MPFPAAAAIAAGASLAGGMLGSSSAAQQNREEREWQEYMSNTQYQRGVADIRAAGLNPAMLYGKGGIAADVGGGARFDESTGVREGVKGVGGAALMQAQINQLNSATAVNVAEAKLKNLEKDIREFDFQGESKLPGVRVKPNAIVPGGLEIPASQDYERRGRMIMQQRVVDVMRGKAQIEDIGSGITARAVQNSLTAIQERMVELGIPEKEAMAALYEKYGDKIAGARGITEVLGILKLIFSMLK